MSKPTVAGCLMLALALFVTTAAQAAPAASLTWDNHNRATLTATGLQQSLRYDLQQLKSGPWRADAFAHAPAPKHPDANGSLKLRLTLPAIPQDGSIFVVLFARPQNAQEGEQKPVLFGRVESGADRADLSPSLGEVIYGKPKAAKHVAGEIIADDFNDDTIDFTTWRIWQQDAGLEVAPRNGRLVIAGKTGQPRQISRDAGFRFTGLVSTKRMFPADGVMVAKMRIPGGLKSESGSERYIVHYCAATPDYYTEVMYSREKDGRAGWMYRGGSQFGHNDGVEPTDLGPWNGDAFKTVKIDHDSKTQVSQGYVWSDVKNDWVKIGQPLKLFMSSAQAELKVNIPQDGLDVRVEFDDCRIYRDPATTPVKILVYKMPPPLFAFPGVTVKLYEADGKTLIGQGITDANGIASVPLSTRLTYPIGAVIRMSHDGKDLGEARIDAEGVTGLYPGDLWTINAPGRFIGTYARER